jgi:GNAT superfamily N-acetyltransferase
MQMRIRRALAADVDLLVRFALREALDAEHANLDPAAVRRGVSAAIDDPRLARYWVAEADDGAIVASISALTEWSNFHGGFYWWVQSLFVVPEQRGRGIGDRLLDHVAGAASDEGALDLRLYAHQANERALRMYRRCGFTAAPYAVMRRRL